jgi:thiamine-phosphate pyrophosphorylase
MIPAADGGAGLPRLMLVTDRRRTRGRPLVEQVIRAVEGGVGIVQLRERDLPDDELRGLLDRIRRRLGPEVPLVVNDRSRVARTRATGLHLGAGVPFPRDPADGRREDYPLFGRSAHDAAEARAALRDRPSYMIVGTIFPTESKPGHPGSGTGLLSAISRLVLPLPVYAIGGITVSSIPALIRAGAHGAAVCGAILGANDPGRVAQAMSLALQVSARAARGG